MLFLPVYRTLYSATRTLKRYAADKSAFSGDVGMFYAWEAATTLQTRDPIPNYNWLQPATCHLQTATCELRPATDFTNLHAELFFASRIKWARAECTFGLSLREAQSERASGAKRARLQMSVTSAMCSQMWGSNCVTTCSKMPECIL